jgi:hypothetical protein
MLRQPFVLRYRSTNSKSSDFAPFDKLRTGFDTSGRTAGVLR